MDVLLREVRPASSGIAEYRDIEVSAEIITIGSSADRIIQFLGANVAAEHAELRQRDGNIEIVCKQGSTAVINDSEVRTAKLAPGDIVEVGNNILTFIDPPVGFDVAIQIEVDTGIDAGVFEKAFQTEVDQLWVSNRVVAWVLSIVILGVGFLLPLQQAGRADNELVLAELIPSDALWTSGPLHPAHELAIGDNCKACHQVFFERVKDAACLECHVDIADHVDMTKPISHPILDSAPRCATCHREHNEPDPHLIIRADVLCVDCHGNTDQFAIDNLLAQVSGFSESAHPEFDAKLLMSVATAGGTGMVFEWRTTEESVVTATEASNLKFPHDTHLDPMLVTSQNSGDRLECKHCHKLSLDRQHFVPITMETVCIECHELTFDAQMPDRQLPHGEPLEAMIALEGQYLRNFSDPDTPLEAVVRRRLPDRHDDDQDCIGTAFECASAAAAQAINEQFTIRGCVSCHVVTDSESEDVYTRYQVFPVRLTTDYFPAGRFDHYSHQVMREDSGDAACLQCHAAQDSSKSSDLLIPGIETCLDCHSEVAEPVRVNLQCIHCHSYHPFGSAYMPTLEPRSL